jgi:hypothetical protein
MLAPDSEAFRRQFRGHARRIHGGQVLRGALTGALLGAGAATLGGAALWALRLEPRWAALALAGLGATVGAGLGFARRFDTQELALFLDGRLGSAEAVSTALGTLEVANEPAKAVRARAVSALRDAKPRHIRFLAFKRWHALLVPALTLAVGLCAMPRRAPRAESKPARGLEIVKRSVPGLERIEALTAAPSLSPSDAERMKQLSAEARRLAADLARGLEKREAQARIAALRDGIAAARQRFGDRAERAGLEAALAALGNERATEHAAKALGDGDIVAFDEAMQRLANSAEATARDHAKRALEEAARAAREKGAPRLAELLDRQKKSFAERETQLKTLRELERELANKLGPEARRDLAELDANGDPAAARRLAEALAEAVSGLSEEERRALADKLKARLNENGAGAAASDADLERMLRDLATKQGREALRDRLRELARGENPDAERERGLGEAERGGADAERGLGSGAPVPLPTPSGPGNGTGAPSAKAGGQPGEGAGNGLSGPGKHEGQTQTVPGEALRAKAQGRWLPGAPLAARSMGRAPGRAGETANQVGSGELGSHASSEVSAVERADIPEEYRQQVGRYFEP